MQSAANPQAAGPTPHRGKTRTATGKRRATGSRQKGQRGSAKTGKITKMQPQRTVNTTPRRRTRRSTDEDVAGWVREEARREGCAVLVVVQERVGQELDESIETCALGDGSVMEKRGRGAKRPSRRGKRGGRISATTCRALAAVGHVQRSRIMAKLLEGPATYRTLQRVTKLKAGPLYHHINQLRLAGLMLPKERDLYELTRGGRNLILTVMAMGKLIRDTKRRPFASQ